MSYFPARLLLKLSFLIPVPYLFLFLFLFCIPVFSQAGGRVNDDDEWVRIRPAGLGRPEISKRILNQKIEARKALGESRNSKRNQRRGSPYQRPDSVERSTGSNEASAQKEGELGSKRAFQPSNAAGSEQPQQEVTGVRAGSPTPNYGYENVGTIFIDGEHTEIKIASDGSFIAGIKNDKVVIYIPPRSENEGWIIRPLEIQATSLAISEDGLFMATANDHHVLLWRKKGMVSQWRKIDDFGNMDNTVKAIKFSQRGNYVLVTQEGDDVYVGNRRGNGYVVMESGDLLAINEQDDFIVNAIPDLKSGMTLFYQAIKAAGRTQTYSEKHISQELQNLHLSPDGQMILGLNENTQWVWGIIDDGVTIGEYYTSMCRCRVNMSEVDISLGNYPVMDVFIDDNFAVITRLSEGCVELTHIRGTSEKGYKFVQTDLKLPANDDVKLTSAFYIPKGDRVACIFSDGSMRMWQGIAMKGDAQKPSVVPSFGKILYYNGPENCFLVKDSSGRVIVRQWSEQ